MSLLCSLGVSVFADTGDNETTSGDQDAKTVVWVSAEAATFKVTVPSALAFSIAADGTVTAPSNLEIANESNGPVYVSDVTVNADCQWAIDANGQDYQTVPVNSKRLTLTLNSTNAPATAVGNESSFGTLSRDDGYWPVIMGNDSLDITAAADFAEQGTALTTPQSVVHVIYTIAWHTEDDGIDDGTTSTPTTTHTVSYNANGGTGTMASASVESGNQYQIAANKFTNGTRDLLGWATSATGDVVYAPRASFIVTGDVELFAKWEEIAHVVNGVIQDSWDDIIAAVNDGSYDEVYSIGDKKILDLGTEGEVYMQIVAFDADELADGSGTAHITWISEQVLKTNHRMNPYYSAGTEGTGALGGWEKSEMRTYLKDTIKPLIPSNVRSAIKSVTKYSLIYDTSDTKVNNVTSTDDVWIPSAREVGFSEYGFETEGPTYFGVENNAARVKMRVGTSRASVWLLRSAADKGYFTGVTTGGGNDACIYTAAGVVLGFCT